MNSISTAETAVSKISLIVAMTRDRLIGSQNQLPWKLPADLKYFKETTGQSPLIMGRKTFDSIGRPLPGRKNIVVSRQPENIKEPAVGVNSIEAALLVAVAEKQNEIFIIGGSQLFIDSLPRANRLYITWIDADFKGDVFFPEFDLSKYKEISRFSNQEPFPHHYCVYDRA